MTKKYPDNVPTVEGLGGQPLFMVNPPKGVPGPPNTPPTHDVPAHAEQPVVPDGDPENVPAESLREDTGTPLGIRPTHREDGAVRRSAPAKKAATRKRSPKTSK